MHTYLALMPHLKLRYPQPHLPPERLKERFLLAKVHVAITRAGSEMAFPRRKVDLELLMVLTCVFIADAEGRAATATKLAAHAGLPRATVYRRVEQLLDLNKIVRIGRNYYLAPRGASPDDNGRMSKLLSSVLAK